MKRRIAVKLTRRRIAWSITLAIVLVFAAILSAPSVDAGRWKDPLSSEIQRALGRRVEIGNLHYSLVPSPGLIASNIVIADDPAFGIEPFAYVTEIHVGLSLTALVTGRLEASSFRLTDASINLARDDVRGWNAGQFLAGMAATARRGNPPALSLRAARINFRSGLVKSPHYLNNVDVDLQPSAEPGGRLTWTYEASPARTDRAEQGFGRFTGDGSWSPSRGPDGAIEVNAELETSALSEVVTFVAGQDLGLQGRVSSRARLDGPLNAIRIQGHFELLDVERAGVFGLRGRQFRLPLEGALNLPAQSLQLRLAPPAQESGQSTPPLEVLLSSSQILVDPDWTAEFRFGNFPADTFADLAQRLGTGLPPGYEITGSIEGSLSFVRKGQTSGNILIRDASLRTPTAGPFTTPLARVEIAGGEIRLLESTVSTAKPETTLTLAGAWSPTIPATSLDLKFPPTPIQTLTSAATLVSSSSVPFLGACESGTAAGALRFRSTAVETWSAQLSLEDLSCPVEGASGPVQLDSATLAIRDSSWTLRAPSATWGTLTGSAELIWKPAARRPLIFDISVDEASLASIEDLLLPTLSRRGSLLDRTLSFGRRRTPRWLLSRHIAGKLSFQNLSLFGREPGPARANFFWDASGIEFSSLHAVSAGATIDGLLRISLSGSEPSYRLLALIDNWRDEKVTLTADTDLRASGIGEALLDDLRATGEFHLFGLQSSDDPLAPLRGSFDYSARRSPAKWRLHAVEASLDDSVLVGSGLSSTDGRFLIDLSSPARNLRLSFPFAPWVRAPRP